MDIELQVVRSHLRLAAMALQQRTRKLENTRSKLSRHYSTVAHTAALLVLLEELQGLVLQDPDLWDDEPENVPF